MTASLGVSEVGRPLTVVHSTAMGGLEVNAVPIVGQPIAYGVGFIALLVVGFSRFIGSYFHTYAHEGGHMLAGLAILRPLRGFTMADDTSALTVHEGRRFAFGNVVLLASGYLAPPLLGLGGAALIALGNPWAVLLAAVGLSIPAVAASRNALAFTIPTLVVLGLGWLLVAGSATVQAAVAAGVVWFLLIRGTVEAFRLPTGAGDAASLASRTLVPGAVWKLFWIAVALIALIVGGQLLLRPGYLDL